MKRIIKPLILSVVALAFAVPSITHAAEKPTPPPPRHTVIANISSDSISVDTGKKVFTYKIDKFTRIFSDGKKVTTADLKSGMRVNVTQGTDKTMAAVINASAPPKPTPPPKK